MKAGKGEEEDEAHEAERVSTTPARTGSAN